MSTQRVFIASSMTDERIRELRSLCNNVVDRANKNISCSLADIEYRVDVVGETIGVSGNADSQSEINSLIEGSNLFVMILKNGEKIGKQTLKEYKTALTKSKASANREPFIKIYLIKDHKSDPVNVSYLIDDLKQDADDVCLEDNFEDRVYIDSKRYLDIIDSSSFCDQFYDYLTQTYPFEKKKFKQSEISYHQHISGTPQGELRNHKHKYFRRENIDDELDRVAKESSLIILEGNIYSGKTCAAYELMKQDRWKDAIFHIYRCNHDSAYNDLNLISFNTPDSIQDKVILIDDINDALRDRNKVDGCSPLWSELRALSRDRLPNWPKTTVIITIAGSLSIQEKDDLYIKIFGESYAALKPMLDRITVNFDIYDRSSFKKMVNEMVRHGIIPMNDVKSGNYTIGSLFIQDEVIRHKMVRLVREDTMRKSLKTISLNWKYANKELRGSIPEMKRLYRSLIKSDRVESIHPLDTCLEILRREGFVFFNNDKVLIDSFVIDAINYVLGADADDTQALIDYAAEIIQIEGANDKTFRCIEQMGYNICEGAALSDDNIKRLVKQVFCKITGEKYDGELSVKGVAWLMMRICKKQNHHVYSRNFCATAALKISDFDFVYNVMMWAKEAMFSIQSKVQNESNEAKKAEYIPFCESYKTLYKGIAYALISQQRHLNMHQEELVLKEIFSEVKDGRKIFSYPFEESDLKAMHTFKRIIPHLERSIDEIITLAENARPDLDDSEECSVKDSDADDFLFEPKKSDTIDSQIEKIFLPQLRHVIISAMKKSEDFNEFESIVNRLRETQSDYLQQALNGYFAILFYFNVRDIAYKYSYKDRFRFFEFIINLEDTSCIIDHRTFVNNPDVLLHTDKHRIISLNSLLELLDESDALKAYYRMKSENKDDGFTCSILFKNEFLTFEQLLHIASSDEGKYLIQNQLLAKAKTIDDSRACLRLMGIYDADPSRLKDQYALGHYLSSKFITPDECFDIVRRWKERHNNQPLNIINLAIITERFTYEQLKSIFDGNLSDQNGYSLSAEELEEIVRNPICYQLLFNKATEVEGQVDYINERFNRLLNDDDLLPIVIDSRFNSGTAILSAYLKNKEIFPTYESVIEWWQNFYEKYSGTLKKTSYIYKALLFRIQELAQEKGKDWFRKETNILLVEAYEYFAQHHGKDKVVSEMSQLYNFILRAMDEKDIDEPLEYAFERECIVMTLPEYLKFILNHTPAYANGTFVFYTLKLMNNSIHEKVIEYITKIAKKNKSGITLESIKGLHDKMASELIKINHGEIYVNTDLISNFSDIKLLWWLLDTDKINYRTAQSYLEKNKHINVTQSYLNMAFSRIYDAYKGKAYDEMKSLLDKYVTDDSPGFFKSIQMCLSMIKASHSEETLLNTLDIFPAEYKEMEECLGAILQKYLSLSRANSSDRIDGNVLLNKLKEYLTNRRDMVTVHHVNSYVLALMMILNRDVIADDELIEKVHERMEHCWEYMNNNEGDINVSQLLELKDVNWILKSNVQTYTYFPMFDSLLPVHINQIFNKNYTYAKNKICLRDCIKNFSNFCGDNYSEVAVNAFAEVLSDDSNQGVRHDVAFRDLLNTRGVIPDLYIDIANACPELITETCDYICKRYIAVNHIKYLVKNEERIDQLRKLLQNIKKQPHLRRKENKSLYDAIFNK